MQGLGVKIKQNINKLAQEIGNTSKKAVDAKFMKEIGEEAKRLIFLRTKLGYGVAKQNTPRQKLKPLSSFYVELRKLMKKDSLLDPSTSAKKSNLTFSGQMLRSLQVKHVQNGKVWLGPIGYRDDGLTNQQVANTVSKERPFMFLSDLETKKINRFAQNQFTSVFKSRFK